MRMQKRNKQCLVMRRVWGLLQLDPQTRGQAIASFPFELSLNGEKPTVVAWDNPNTTRSSALCPSPNLASTGLVRTNGGRRQTVRSHIKVRPERHETRLKVRIRIRFVGGAEYLLHPARIRLRTARSRGWLGRWSVRVAARHTWKKKTTNNGMDEERKWCLVELWKWRGDVFCLYFWKHNFVDKVEFRIAD